MGCENSKPTVVPNAHVEPDPEVVTSDFSDTQIDTIRSTWPVLSRDVIRIGAEIFVRIFIDAPGVKKLFEKFSVYNVDDLRKSPQFRDHAEKFMQVLQNIVDNLECLAPVTQHELMALGASHVLFDGFDTHYFGVYSKCMLEVWEQELGEEFIQEVRECWKAVFEYLVTQMSEGYDMCVQEQRKGISTMQDNEHRKNKVQREYDVLPDVNAT
ncbi:neuroglobin-like [Haliotis cracherodii]|uniref:neuroglobin-like n=1 Tax=Haliotis cracherodii TaxID=6455 RepID=UPI0039ED4D0A